MSPIGPASNSSSIAGTPGGFYNTSVDSSASGFGNGFGFGAAGSSFGSTSFPGFPAPAPSPFNLGMPGASSMTSMTSSFGIPSTFPTPAFPTSMSQTPSFPVMGGLGGSSFPTLDSSNSTSGAGSGGLPAPSSFGGWASGSLQPQTTNGSSGNAVGTSSSNQFPTPNNNASLVPSIALNSSSSQSLAPSQPALAPLQQDMPFGFSTGMSQGIGSQVPIAPTSPAPSARPPIRSGRNFTQPDSNTADGQY